MPRWCFLLAFFLFFLARIGLCFDEILLENFELLDVVELKADLDHVQGIATDGVTFWVTSVRRKEKIGQLHKFDAQTGELILKTNIHSGELYHPGGLSLDGDRLWIPVAAYRRESVTTVQCRDKNTLKLITYFFAPDHIGCLAVDRERIYGGNWDSLDIYVWDKTGLFLKKTSNFSKTSYQDIKVVNGDLIGSGILDGKGVIDWVDLGSFNLEKRLWGGKTDRGVLYMHEGMAMYAGKLYLMPEDGPSRVFVFQLDKNP